MPEDEGLLLHRHARDRLPHGPVLEVGTYCGKSAIYLGAAAAREVGGPQAVVFTVDHHRGSGGEPGGLGHHDASLVDDEFGLMDTLPVFRRTIARAGLEDQVVAVIGRSTTVSAHWRTPPVAAVHRRRARRGARRPITPGGRRGSSATAARHPRRLPDPADGEQPPYHVFLRARGGAFTEVEALGSMRVLRRPQGRLENRSAEGLSADGQPHSRPSSAKCGASEVPR